MTRDGVLRDWWSRLRILRAVSPHTRESSWPSAGLIKGAPLP